MQLVKYDAARRALQEAHSIDEVKDIRDKAEALAAYARQAKDTQMIEWVTEIKVRAERRAGQMLAEMPKHPGGRPSSKNLSHDGIGLSDIGVTLNQSSRWQKLASIPDEQFEQAVLAAKEVAGEVTTAAMLKINKENRSNELLEQRSNIAKSAEKIKISDRWKIHHADINTWKSDKKFDWIITDPPYPKEFLPLWESLAIRANEWLKEGGLLVAMSGQSYLDQIYESMSKHLKYYWTACYLTPGQPTPLRQVWVNTSWKPLLIFCKGNYTGKIFGDVFKSDPSDLANNKDLHKWGQSVSGMTDIISKMVLPGQSILDPFCGAGTTGVAALRHGCFFEGLELDEQNCNISRARLNEETCQQ